MIEKLMTTTSEIIGRIEREGQNPSQRQDVLLDELGKIYDDEAVKRLEQIRAFLVRTDDNHREIIEGKTEGRSNDAWLKARLASKEQEFPGLTKGISQGFQDLSGASNQNQLLALDEANSFDFNIMLQNIKKSVVSSTLSGLTAIDDAMMKVVLEKSLPDPYLRLNHALKSEMNSEEDREMKELLTVGALKFVRDADRSSMLMKLDHVRTTAIVDAAYTTSKITYKIANNSMSSEDAIEFVVDRGIARFESFVHTTCITFGQKAGMVVGRTIGAVFGPAGIAVGGVIGGMIGSLAGQKVASLISSGARKVTTSVVRNVVGVAKSVVSGIKEFFS